MMSREKEMNKSNSGNPYKDLANAIIRNAVNDYREALERKLENKTAELEKFFFSQWFEMLSDVDGGYIVRKIREEYCLNSEEKHDS